jgi:hypothetical protein
MPLAASITYSFNHLTGETSRLLAAVCLFHSAASAAVLTVFFGRARCPRAVRRPRRTPGGLSAP